MAMAGGAVIACHTNDEFDAQMTKANESGKLVIIDFMTSWCHACQMIAPVYAECAKKYPAAVFLEVNAEQLKEVAKKYNIHAYPTFFFIRNGETLESFVGADADELVDTINKYYYYYGVGGGTPASAQGRAPCMCNRYDRTGPPKFLGLKK